MRVLVAALLAVFATGTDAAQADLAVSVATRPLAQGCAIVSTATIIAFDAGAPQAVSYRFLRSDGSASAIGRLALAGDGAVAQSVRDTWTPHGRAPWIAVEIVEPRHMLSHRVPVGAPCPRRDVAEAR